MLLCRCHCGVMLIAQRIDMMVMALPAPPRSSFSSAFAAQRHYPSIYSGGTNSKSIYFRGTNSVLLCSNVGCPKGRDDGDG